MASPILLFAFLVLALACGGLGYAFGYLTANRGPSQDAAIAERDAFIEHLRELAWQNRDVAPELSTIMIDEITRRHLAIRPHDQQKDT